MYISIRETRAVVDGPLAIVRFGTCGGLSEQAVAGSIVVNTSSGYILRDPDYFEYLYHEPFSNESAHKAFPYRMFCAAPSDHILTECVFNELKKAFPTEVAIRKGTSAYAYLNVFILTIKPRETCGLRS